MATSPLVSPTPMALPVLPPELMLPIETAPPLAEAVAVPPLPAAAMSSCAAAPAVPNRLATAPAIVPNTRLLIAFTPSRFAGAFPSDGAAVPRHRGIGYRGRADFARGRGGVRTVARW